MSDIPKLVSVEKDVTTLSELEAKKFVTIKTRELASFLKFIHDTLAQNDINKAKQLIADFLTSLAEAIQK
ncbi:MAG TPA: hypothetical protein VMV49_10075 [Candidatus Deferrimicrobium sp.]|nr:hypothetical protein [Candidatus Deferrimicrobium sp.]